MTSVANKLLLILQGPIFSPESGDGTFEIFKEINRFSLRNRINLVFAAWDDESNIQIERIRPLVDDLYLLKKPSRRGSCSRLWQQFAVAGTLKNYSPADYPFVVKSRSDLMLSEHFLGRLLDFMENGSFRLGSTNLFTRYEPFHLSDMVVFGPYQKISDYFGDFSLFYEDLFSPEVQFTRGYIRAQKLPYYYTLEDYFRFLAKEVELIDYDTSGLIWLKAASLTARSYSASKPILRDRDCGPVLCRLVSMPMYSFLRRTEARFARIMAVTMMISDIVLRALAITVGGSRHFYTTDSAGSEISKSPEQWKIQ